MGRVATSALALAAILAPACKKDAPAQEITERRERTTEPEEADLPPRPLDAPVHYAIAVSKVLDLVPHDTLHYVAIRDPTEVFALLDPFVQTGSPALRAALPKARAEDLDRITAAYADVRTQLTAGDFEPTKGLVIFDAGGSLAFVYASPKPDALAKLAEALGADKAPKCKAVAAAPGYAVCAMEPSIVDGYTPGNAGTSLEAALAKALTGIDLTRMNAIGSLTAPVATPFAIATPPGLLHAVSAPPRLPPEFGDTTFSPGPAEALGLTPPGSGFVWARVSDEELTRQSPQVPAIARPLFESVTGEIYLGGIDDPAAMALLVGVDDPLPASGVISLASLHFDKAPGTLPDGSKMAVELYDVEVDEGLVRTVHADVTPTKQSQAILDVFAADPQLWAFAAGKYAAVVTGADDRAVTRIAQYARTSPRASVLRGLPLPLARSIEAERAGFVMHIPVDVLSTDLGHELLDIAVMTIPEGSLPPETSTDAVIEAAAGLLRPLSSASSWIEPTAAGPLTHAAFAVIGDARTPDGKAALQTLQALTEKKVSPSAAFAELAKAHGDTARGYIYRARATPDPAATMGAMVTFGLATAIAVPASLGTDAAVPVKTTPKEPVAP